MRGTAARVAGAVALLSALAACSGGGRDTQTIAACGNMKHAISAFDRGRPIDPQSIGQAYADVAHQVRAQIGKVKDDSVRTAALKVADALDALADDMRAYAAGNFKVPATDRLTSSVAELQRACGS